MAAIGRWDSGQVHDEAGRRKYLSSEERSRFLARADCLAPDMRALCHVLAFTGCRVSEALALTIHHIDTDRMTLTLKTLKRRRVVFRAVPVPQAVIDMLLPLTRGDDGRFFPVHRVTAWRVIKAAMSRAGVTGPMSSPKGLRHGFGMKAAGHNVPVSIIQRWMGHASATTTAIYLDAVGVEERRFARRLW
jgi:integrase